MTRQAIVNVHFAMHRGWLRVTWRVVGTGIRSRYVRDNTEDAGLVVGTYNTLAAGLSDVAAAVGLRDRHGRC